MCNLDVCHSSCRVLTFLPPEHKTHDAMCPSDSVGTVLSCRYLDFR